MMANNENQFTLNPGDYTVLTSDKYGEYDTAVFRLIHPPRPEWKGVTLRFLTISFDGIDDEEIDNDASDDDDGMVDATVNFDYEIIESDTLKPEELKENHDFNSYLAEIIRDIIMEYFEENYPQNEDQQAE